LSPVKVQVIAGRLRSCAERTRRCWGNVRGVRASDRDACSWVTFQSREGACLWLAIQNQALGTCGSVRQNPVSPSVRNQGVETSSVKLGVY